MEHDDELQTITLAAHESEMVREHKTLRTVAVVLALGWLVSVLVLGGIIYAYATAEYEVTTETTTTETTETVSQDGGEGGSAIYAEGDVNGETDDNASN